MKGVQLLGVDFGPYHHSTPEESDHIRESAEKAFFKLLRPLYPFRATLKILDAGCGLGFLTYLFRHGSISGISMDRAAKNMKSLGLDSRTSLPKQDLREPLKSEVQFDLAISNLVFHNMGKKRFNAYDTVFDALKPKGYFVIGDLFPSSKADMDYFRERSTLVDERHEGRYGRWDYQIKVLRNK